MPEVGADTFARLLKQKIDDKVIRPEDSVLVQFGGQYDERICESVGLRNCHFANIAPGSASTGVTVAERFDAHNMPQENGSFDHVIAHAGLHHCSRPHEALHEMYRLARKTVLFVENQDSLAMRAAGKVGVVSWFEQAAVVGSGYVSGGVDGTAVPNYVYRWTRREVTKAVAAFDPGVDVPVEFFSEWNLGAGRVSSLALRNKFRVSSDDKAERFLKTGQAFANRIARRQGNIFAATIRKDLAQLRPWMEDPTRMRHLPTSEMDSA